MRNLEDVLRELKEAEKEYQDKCLKYGIQEKAKRKPKAEEQQSEANAVTENSVETNVGEAQNEDNTEKSQEN